MQMDPNNAPSAACWASRAPENGKWFVRKGVKVETAQGARGGEDWEKKQAIVLAINLQVLKHSRLDKNNIKK